MDALAILASSELITKELNEAVLEEKTIEYNSDVRYTIGGKFLSDHLEAFNSQNKCVLCVLLFVSLLTRELQRSQSHQPQSPARH